MTEQTICKQCGNSLPPDAPDGSCPNCLLGLAMNGAQSALSSPGGSSLSGSAGEAFTVPAADQLIGKFPNLEIEHLIGRGGMGAVYRARQTNLDRVVALKILSPRLGADPTFTERFTREAKTLAKLAHPNIVTVFDFGQTDSINYLVMEFVDGVNLRDAIQLGRIKPDRALEIVQQICEALQYAHDSGVIHRDIKPENILVDRRGHVKIADFGLAKLLQPTAEDFTLTGTRQVLGTLSYMAPEQIEKPQTVDHRADLYSLGVVFYELLTGELPIGRFAPPSEKSRCSSGLDEVVMRTLEKEPDRRFQQASQLKSAVEDYDSLVANMAHGNASAEAGFNADTPKRDPFHGQRGDGPITESVPFRIKWLPGKLHANIPGANALGIMRAFDSHIEMEVEYKDFITTSHAMWKKKSGAVTPQISNIRIPVDSLAAVEFKPSIFGDTIHLQATSMKAMGEIPGATQGGCTLSINRKDRHRAADFADQLNRTIISRNPGRTVAPVPPVKDDSVFSVSEEEVIIVDESLKVPRIGLFCLSFIQMFCAIIALCIGSFLMYRSFSAGRERMDFDIGSMFLAASLGLIVASLLLFFISRNLKAHLNYHFVIAGLVVCLILPASPPLVLQLPFVIWALIALCFRKTRDVFHSETLEHRREMIRKRLNQNRFGANTTAMKKSSMFAKLWLPCVIIALAIGAVVVQGMRYHDVATQEPLHVVDQANDSGVAYQFQDAPAHAASPLTIHQDTRGMFINVGILIVGVTLAVIAFLIAWMWDGWYRRKRNENESELHDVDIA